MECELKFDGFPKMARLYRESVITEKIDGTNGQIYIRELPDNECMPTHTPLLAVYGKLLIYAGSRTRWVTPDQDNYGFAAWVKSNSGMLAALGPGRHFGEWWGNGINRGYGLAWGDKRFSLFNTIRWHLHGEKPKLLPCANPKMKPKYQDILPPCVGLVPELSRRIFSTQECEYQLGLLKEQGSYAMPGFMQPEGIVCWHIAANIGFKRTFKGDDTGKEDDHSN